MSLAVDTSSSVTALLRDKVVTTSIFRSVRNRDDNSLFLVNSSDDLPPPNRHDIAAHANEGEIDYVDQV